LHFPARINSTIFLVPVVTTAVNLLFSYSRGAWLGTAVGLLWLGKAYGQFKWRFLVLALFTIAAVASLFWNIPDREPWYIKRLDLSRNSVQHRLAAWKAGLEIMRDYPVGVGWNRTVETYQEYYSPPKGGALAITTNDYLMLGTQVGWLGLACFLMYVLACFGGAPVKSPERSIKIACRAAVVAMLVEFWFDGGLFKLATASVFWILLELGRADELPKSRPSTAELAAPR